MLSPIDLKDKQMRKEPNVLKIRLTFFGGEASGWGVLALVVIVLIVCMTLIVGWQAVPLVGLKNSIG